MGFSICLNNSEFVEAMGRKSYCENMREELLDKIWNYCIESIYNVP
jgi:hypothetical protein